MTFDAKTATQALVAELDEVGFDAAPDTETPLVERHMQDAYRKGAEEMWEQHKGLRQAARAVCDLWAGPFDADGFRETPIATVYRGQLRWEAAKDLRDAIRALPIEGE